MSEEINIATWGDDSSINIISTILSTIYGNVEFITPKKLIVGALSSVLYRRRSIAGALSPALYCILHCFWGSCRVNAVIVYIIYWVFLTICDVSGIAVTSCGNAKPLVAWFLSAVLWQWQWQRSRQWLWVCISTSVHQYTSTSVRQYVSTSVILSVFTFYFLKNSNQNK